MTIDWFTLVAQVVNFLLLVWLLERLLYRPVLRVMGERRARIEQAERDAAAALAAARDERAALARERAELAARNAALLAAAEREAAQVRDEALATARAEVAAARSRWQAALAEERKSFESSLRQAVENEVVAVARAVLADLADSPFEARVGAAFARRLRTLAEAERGALRQAMSDGTGHGVCLRSALVLDEETRRELEAAVHEVLGATVCPRFEQRPGLVCGIELAVDGHKLSWSVDEYLHDLGARLAAPAERRTDGG
ncbi:MAG: F0F1 ATP synthase subunit B [Gammaproteobacteria bacterium]